MSKQLGISAESMHRTIVGKQKKGDQIGFGQIEAAGSGKKGLAPLDFHDRNLSGIVVVHGGFGLLL
jgi:hypothetical protein